MPKPQKWSGHHGLSGCYGPDTLASTRFVVQEYLKAQIAAKAEAKRRVKEQAELEERLEEARMRRDRQRLEDEFKREAEKAKRKEVCVDTPCNVCTLLLL